MESNSENSQLSCSTELRQLKVNWFSKLIEQNLFLKFFSEINKHYSIENIIMNKTK